MNQSTQIHMPAFTGIHAAVADHLREHGDDLHSLVDALDDEETVEALRELTYAAGLTHAHPTYVASCLLKLLHALVEVPDQQLEAASGRDLEARHRWHLGRLSDLLARFLRT